MSQALEAIAQAIFKSWFVDFDLVHAKSNGEDAAEIHARLGLEEATQALFPSQVKEHGPDGWRPVTLKELTTKIGSGATPRGGREVYVEEGIALIRARTSTTRSSSGMGWPASPTRRRANWPTWKFGPGMCSSTSQVPRSCAPVSYRRMSFQRA